MIFHYQKHTVLNYWERLVSDIPAVDGKIDNLFLQCIPTTFGMLSGSILVSNFIHFTVLYYTVRAYRRTDAHQVMGPKILERSWGRGG